MAMPSESQDVDPEVMRRGLLHRLGAVWLMLSVGITAISLTAGHWWIADLLANLRIQVIIGLLPLVLIGLVTRSYRITASAVFLLCWHVWFLKVAMMPVEDAGTSEFSVAGSVETSHGLTVCLSNVLRLNDDLDRICESLRKSDADVLAIVELNEFLQAKLMHEFAEDYPYFVLKSQRDGAFGIGMLSRYPLKNCEFINFSEDWMPSISADVELPSRSVRIFVTHPTPPMSQTSFDFRNRHLMSLVGNVKSVLAGQPDLPVLVVGDLNLTPWTSRYQDLLRESGLIDASAGRGLTPTWYRWPAFPFGLMLDHAWYSTALKCRTRTILPDMGSDHRPVLLEFSLTASQ
jgi:endonuclease/exonuclease/phosphatase (EEP) superfamily protein YafD